MSRCRRFILGRAVLATIAITATKDKLQTLLRAGHGHLGHAAAQAATSHGYTTAFLVGAGVALLALFISAAVIRVDSKAVAAMDVATPAG